MVITTHHEPHVMFVSKEFPWKSLDGRTIAAYRFGSLDIPVPTTSSGRRVFPKWLKEALYKGQGGHCAICNGKFLPRYLQIDHCIPYGIGGDENELALNIKNYMLVCVSCNRAKSWSCEHCPNWKVKSTAVCHNCYWANPTDYTHIALQEVRRLDLIWQDDEIERYEQLKEMARQLNSPLPEYVKTVIQRVLIENEPDRKA